MAQVAVLTIPLTANTTPSVGSATATFARNFEAAYLSALPDTWAEAAHNVAAFGVYGYNTGTAFTSLIAFGSGENRDLTDADWTKTDITAAKDQTGMKADANSASSLTATANNGTCLRALTASASTRTFTAAIKRLTGTGTVEITTNGGTNWTDITSQIGSTWTRVTLAANGLNPSVGFRLGTSGDAITVDAVAVVNQSQARYPLLARASDRSADSLVYTALTSPTAGKRYYVQAKVRYDALIGNTLSVDFGDATYGAHNANFNIQLVSSDVLLYGALRSASSVVANINQTTSTSGGRVMTALANLTEVTIGIEFGMRQVVLTLNGVRYSADFGNGNLSAGWWNDPTMGSITNIRVQNTGYINNLEYGERTIEAHYVLLGDSTSSDSKYLLTLEAQETSLNKIWINRGISGNKTTDVTARVTTDVTPFYFSEALSNVVILWVGTNDLAANISAATALGTLQTTINTIAAGAAWDKIYLVNTLHRTAGFSAGATSGSFETQRIAYNAGLSALTGHNGVIDIAAIPELDDSADATYYSDGIHMTQAGYSLAVAEILDFLANPPVLGGSGSRSISPGAQFAPFIF